MGFEAFDPDKKGTITTDTVGTILSMMGMKIPSAQLNSVIGEYDPFGIYAYLKIRILQGSTYDQRTNLSNIIRFFAPQDPGK